MYDRIKDPAFSAVPPYHKSTVPDGTRIFQRIDLQNRFYMIGKSITSFVVNFFSNLFDNFRFQIHGKAYNFSCLPNIRKDPATLIQPPVFARRLSGLSLKDLGKMRGIVKAKLIRDLAD